MNRRKNKSQLSQTLEYWSRQSRRVAILLVGMFVVFIIICCIIYVVPKILSWAFGW